MRRNFPPFNKTRLVNRNPTRKEYICEECSEPCGLHLVDFGIGMNEFWGVPGNDINVALATTCCDSANYKDREDEEEHESTIT